MPVMPRVFGARKIKQKREFGTERPLKNARRKSTTLTRIINLYSAITRSPINV